MLGACAWALAHGERPLWQLWLAGAAALITLIWGGYYALLRYQVDALGISHHSFFCTRNRILWEELDGVTVDEQDSMGTARCTITLRAKDGRTLTLSSDLLPLEEVQELAAELRPEGAIQRS